jgi:hypothetical protein
VDTHAKSERVIPFPGIEARVVAEGAVIPPSPKLEGFRVNRWIYHLAAPLFFLVASIALFQRWRSGRGEKFRFESRLFNQGAEIIPEIQRNGGSGAALHILYRLRNLRGLLFSRVEQFWTNIPIIQAVQNRAVLVRGLVREIILCKPRLRVLELAAGLAEPLLWAVHDTEHDGHGPEAILLTDVNRVSLRQALGIADFFRIQSPLACEWLNLTKPERVQAVIKKFQPGLIEMIGFIDYLNDGQTVKLLKAIRKEAKPGTILITGNVLPISPWQLFFIEQAYGWPRMHYRSRGKLESLLKRAGYSKIEIRVEPNRIFAIAIAHA